MTVQRARSAIRAAANLLGLGTHPPGTGNAQLEQDIAELRGVCTYLEQKLDLNRDRMHSIQLHTLRGLKAGDDG